MVFEFGFWLLGQHMRAESTSRQPESKHIARDDEVGSSECERSWVEGVGHGPCYPSPSRCDAINGPGIDRSKPAGGREQHVGVQEFGLTASMTTRKQLEASSQHDLDLLHSQSGDRRCSHPLPSGDLCRDGASS